MLGAKPFLPHFVVTAQRKREAGKAAAAKAPLSQEEQEALARREAARKRVDQRTKSVFGLA